MIRRLGFQSTLVYNFMADLLTTAEVSASRRTRGFQAAYCAMIYGYNRLGSMDLGRIRTSVLDADIRDPVKVRSTISSWILAFDLEVEHIVPGPPS